MKNRVSQKPLYTFLRKGVIWKCIKPSAIDNLRFCRFSNHGISFPKARHLTLEQRCNISTWQDVFLVPTTTQRQKLCARHAAPMCCMIRAIGGRFSESEICPWQSSTDEITKRREQALSKAGWGLHCDLSPKAWDGKCSGDAYHSRFQANCGLNKRITFWWRLKNSVALGLNKKHDLIKVSSDTHGTPLRFSGLCVRPCVCGHPSRWIERRVCVRAASYW